MVMMMWLIAQLNLFQFVNIQIKRTLQGNLLFMMAILNFDVISMKSHQCSFEFFLPPRSTLTCD